jgi:hypothetical protein
MKNHIYDYYEITGEFRQGSNFNCDELLVHKNGVVVLYIWEEGVKVTKVTGMDGSDFE